MALADRMRKSGEGDAVTRAMRNMDQADLEFLWGALRDPGYRHSDIGEALRDEGYVVTNRQVAAFREKLKQEQA